MKVVNELGLCLSFFQLSLEKMKQEIYIQGTYL